MNHTDLANTLCNESLVSVYQPKFQSNLRETVLRINEGNSHGCSVRLNEIYTKLYITEGRSGDVSYEHEDIFGLNYSRGGSSSVGCLKADVTVLYRMWRDITVAAILMLLTGIQAQHSVALYSQSLCVVTGSTVKIPCKFTPGHSSVRQREWYRVQSSEGEPRDLRKDPQYSGRVSVSTVASSCELTVRNVRVSDSGVYNFRFKTQSSDWIAASSGVHLTVTDLKVTVSDMYSWIKKLSSITTCTLSNNPTYIWYKNGQRVTDQDRNYLYVSSEDAGSYSCAVRGHEELRSPAVCVFDEKSCWSVTYSTQTICSLIGSSVDIHSNFTFPNRYKVTEVFWFIKEQAGAESGDVRDDEEYQGRVQYTQISQNNCRLRITNLRERDAQTYRFRFYTNDPTGKYTGDPGVSLSVTDLKVTVSDWSEQYMNLSCITTCTLSNIPTYIWYKNGQRVSGCKSASCSVAAVGGAVSYSCAVEGHDSLLSPPVYSPKNTSAVVLSSGDTVEGDSVTLSCSSDANPPVLTYSWFKQRAAADTLLTTGQNYSISTISSQHSGLYYCTAHNQLGQHTSRPTHLDVKGDEESSAKVWKLHAVWGAAALVPALLLSLLTAVLCIKRKRGAERDTDIQSVPKPGDDTYTALNPMNTSPDYDTLQNVKSSASDTYTTLNPATVSSDYDTLTGVATRLSEEKFSRTAE
ncbi:sialoadhesin isoform X3 [Ictalurus punctatus]|uniref:Sialoadhesin isoform X3 n=1 Tax=Ictalurus punctatus TaxID=7998 RepID=A0A9F7QYH6_ICTPU|nr:sialoadhesin isoform X3 [Ictalurus punctatus]